MQVTTEHIQPYDATNDTEAVFALWQDTVAHAWPLASSRFFRVLDGPEAKHFVARVNGKVVGFVATYKSFRDHEKIGHLGLLLIDPQMHGQGLGTSLHNAALAHFRSEGLHKIQLGSVSPRFWCGVPTNLSQATKFFRGKGWHYDDTVYDLVQDISSFTVPQRIIWQLQEQSVTIHWAECQNVTDVLAFEAKEFPGWLFHYEQYADLGDFRDMLVARDADNQVVGTVIITSPQSHPDRTDVIWQKLLGDTVGGIMAVGVAEEQRGRGIGLALVAYATEELRSRGVQNCYIDWVVKTEFYAKLGYRPWRSYQTSWRDI
ncbi:MAG TPA: GNAT family N-acetyltransferase [Dictyobacter sp.]|jgi:beta-N-acetylhexosaminidase|nr:GNAT family N-acetyltransferase [Dictyobacter sp.]